jgi:Uma2 family endonuclease
MATMPDMPAPTLTDFTQAELERLEAQHPELGRLEVIDGALHATGGSAVGNLHQLLLQRLHLLFAPLCPSQHVLRLDTWWFLQRGKLRPDVAVYRREDRPEKVHGGFRVPPFAIVEILSDDAHHDLVRKDEIYADHGVRRAYLDTHRRWGWWLRLDGEDQEGRHASWQLDGWRPIPFDREALFDPEG